MSLSVGGRLGPYEILAPIGAGGMGEVYRARDTRLNRDVAIKVSVDRFSERFEREARVIASLNHPNICTLHDVGPNYLVMELVEGPTLADRIKQGALPLGEALPIARQIADALDAAHDKGIVHRDLKPGNVKIKSDGTVKVLDFGLAKTGGTPAIPDDKSPTLTMGQTEAGMILGTAAYMSPEQAKGKEVDKRADIYAFGAVLYEMLTGKRLHSGESTTDVLASVIKEEPKWERVPPQVQRLLQQCLEKDPQRRLRHIGDVMRLVDDVPAVKLTTAARHTGERWLWIGAIAAIVVIAVGVVLWAPWRSVKEALQAVRFEVGPAQGMTFNAGAYMTLSPDGHWMVFQANAADGMTRFWIRSIDGVDLRPLPGTENITATSPPAAWSYDSRWVVYSAGPESKLKKIDIQGGPPQVIGDWPNGLNGASWNADGLIIGGATRNGTPILKIPAAGGQPSPVTALAPGETAHLWPQFLPDGKHFLYERVSSDSNKSGVYIGSTDVKPDQQSMDRLLASDRQAYYAALPGSGAGHLIFMRGSTLMAQPFDAAAAKLSGDPVAIADQVDSFAPRNGGLFSVSNNGTLAYRIGSGQQTFLTWFDAQGRPVGTIGDPGNYFNPAVSADGSRVAVAVANASDRDIWILDAKRGISTRFTFDPHIDDAPSWSPDNKSITFASNRANQFDLYIGTADSPGQEKLLLHTEEPKAETFWTRDGRFLLFTSIGNKTVGDVWALPMQGEAKPVALAQTQYMERFARVSPDGRWMAYTSLESGNPEVYVRPFSPEAGGAGPKWQVSKGGGIRPIWRQDGKGLFYLTVNLQVMFVDVDASKSFIAQTPRRLFASPALATTQGWDIAPDGRFLFVTPPNGERIIPFTVVLNWAAKFKN